MSLEDIKIIIPEKKEISQLEEDTWYLAKLVDIKEDVVKFKGVDNAVWIWTYELIGDEYSFTTKEGEKKQRMLREMTSQKFTGGIRQSKAFIRYCQLTGGEVKEGSVSLKKLFDTKCKIMIKNEAGKKAKEDGTFPIYSKIEKVTIKGIEQTKSSSPAKETPKVEEEDIFKNL